MVFVYIDSIELMYILLNSNSIHLNYLNKFNY